MDPGPSPSETAPLLDHARQDEEEEVPGSVAVEISPEEEGPKKRSRRSRLKRKIRSLLTARSMLSDMRATIRVPGAPPGIDVKVPNPTLEALFKEDVTIRIVDYSAIKMEIHDLDPSSLAEFLRSQRASWSKVRWIDIRGVNYTVIKQVAEKYKLHPLAVEDVFHFPQAIKADWYDNHIYVSMILTTLEDNDLESDNETSSSPRPAQSIYRAPLFPNRPKVDSWPSVQTRPEITTEQTNFFLLREGVLLSIFQNEGQKVTAPIYTRLGEVGTVLRDSEDASFLLFSLMDTVTDHFFPILDGYKHLLDLMETLVFKDPKAEATQELHVIAKELGVLRRTLMPTKNLVVTLRENGKHFAPTVDVSPPPQPFISKLTKTYLGDVKDHVNTVVDGLESYESDARHLIDLIFNIVSHSTNEAMKTLAVVSLVFLPISFLAGVFGMNFEYFPELHWRLGVYG
ncbi:hypothetical protein SpCBS45565_g03763 [Spizellomyces sp. 'palustris']|nr:hypothetical protein SpCBS45565_g03763 [Spizellomyces sp. 'palustris']